MIKLRALIKHGVCVQNTLFSHSFVLKYSKKAMATEKTISELKSLFSCGVSAVQPKNLFSAENLIIDEKSSKIICKFNENHINIDISNSQQCHLVGFGKAVYGMASELSKVLGERLKSGMISVPLNIQDNFVDIRLPEIIKVFEGAKNNLPDENAVNAASEIIKFTKSLNQNDILFVLISGGGSALLPLPSEGVTLNEKLDIIKKLANKGATISDINRVRIDLSQTKGGKLADGAKNAGAIITFIISDIIGDPIHLIASGPTVIQNIGNEERSMDVLKRFELWDSVPEHIQKMLHENSSFSVNDVKNVRNLIIANNEIAVSAVLHEMNRRNLLGIVMSTAVEGNVTNISKAYFELSKIIQTFKYGKINEKEFLQQLVKLRQMLHIRNNFLQNIVQIVNQSNAEQIDFCIIGAGEPTVEVIGNGIGGRNQELALRFSQLSFDDNLTQDVYLLSAGTDGIDGPTTAAGSIGGAHIIRNYLMIPGNTRNDIDAHIQNNDSFTFYSNLSQYHIITGHTGTNVMDLHLLYFKQQK